MFSKFQVKLVNKISSEKPWSQPLYYVGCAGSSNSCLVRAKKMGHSSTQILAMSMETFDFIIFLLVFATL